MESITTIVSVISPVYNAEKTLPVCLAALSKQTYPYIEFIFINDCSDDGSLMLIEAFRKEMGNRVVVHSFANNKGVAAARNHGLDLAKGDFVYYVDADDRIEPDAIAVMVNAAVHHRADIVGCNWFLSFDEGKRKMNQPAFTEPWDAISQMLAGTMRWNLWLFLTRRSVYEDNQIRFVDGVNMGEDLMVTIKLFIYAQRVFFVKRALYHYRKSNNESLTRVYSNHHIEQVTFHVNEVERSLRESKYESRLGTLIYLLKFHIKLPFLISATDVSYRTWLNWFAEVNEIPWDSRELSFRLRVLSWAALNKQFWILKLHYYLLTRVVYGFIYK